MAKLSIAVAEQNTQQGVGPSPPIVVKKDTHNKKVLLSHEANIYWTTYQDDAAYINHPGWEDAPDDALTSSPSMIAAAAYASKRNAHEDHSAFSGQNFDDEAPYDLWASANLNQIKEILTVAFFKHPTPTNPRYSLAGRDVAFKEIFQFLENIVKRQPATLSLPLAPGTISLLMLQASLYLGNSSHGDQQLHQAL